MSEANPIRPNIVWTGLPTMAELSYAENWEGIGEFREQLRVETDPVDGVGERMYWYEVICYMLREARRVCPAWDPPTL